MAKISDAEMSPKTSDRCPVSVVIPTYQRRESLRRALDALGRQTLSPCDYEVIVSVDGSTDGTREMLAGFTTPYALRIVYDFPNRGRAAACNRGIRQSRGDVVVILDDDMEPNCAFLQSHLCQHIGHPRRAALGPVPISYDESSAAPLRYIGSKFNKHLEKLACPGSRIGCRDFYSGNFSARRSILLEAGLFDESFTVYGNEDVELGLRLVAQDVELVYAPDAVARQHYEKSMAGLAADQVEKGRSAVLLATKHPHCLPHLTLSSYRSGSLKWRVVRRALLTCTRSLPWTRDVVVDCLKWLERRNKRVLDRYFPLVLDYFFWVGASSALREEGVPVAKLQAHLRHPRG